MVLYESLIAFPLMFCAYYQNNSFYAVQLEFTVPFYSTIIITVRARFSIAFYRKPWFWTFKIDLLPHFFPTHLFAEGKKIIRELGINVWKLDIEIWVVGSGKFCPLIGCSSHVTWMLTFHWIKTRKKVLKKSRDLWLSANQKPTFRSCDCFTPL